MKFTIYLDYNKKCFVFIKCEHFYINPFLFDCEPMEGYF